jgi:hypothetical protein
MNRELILRFVSGVYELESGGWYTSLSLGICSVLILSRFPYLVHFIPQSAYGIASSVITV